ncbi:MAG: DMT family transporter [Alphaproteobacteria bacterium]|nr:DMT family transporter [Alphaproteobacteria bacterium]MDA7983855.1 DMT family transporter [Alphaproteobacteria bacterium]MDA8003716.1 DMT family transporter [Alphaproteobacteria bacterium]MDA8005476.1 DMT family transporter [Alphaproteobacteria bacterium]MDA8009994.1 DMT family transporter [Alphaproteobacteria bacterium]
MQPDTIHHLPRGLRRLRVLVAGHGMGGGDNIALGAAYMCLAALGFSLMVVFVRIASEDLPPQQVFFLRMFIGFALLLPWALRHEDAATHVRRPWMMFARGVIGALGGLMFFWGLALLPLAQAVALNFTLPLFAALLAMIFLGERFRWRRWAGIVVGFAGVLVILRPWGGGLLWAMFLPLFAALAMGTCTVLIKKLLVTESPGRILFWHHLWGAAAAAPFGIFVWRWPASFELWGALVAAGVIGSVSALLSTRAIRAAEAGMVIVFDYLRLPITALFAWWFFAEGVDVYTWVGGGMIACAGGYVVHREMVRVGRSPTGRRIARG